MHRGRFRSNYGSWVPSWQTVAQVALTPILGPIPAFIKVSGLAADAYRPGSGAVLDRITPEPLKPVGSSSKVGLFVGGVVVTVGLYTGYRYLKARYGGRYVR